MGYYKDQIPWVRKGEDKLCFIADYLSLYLHPSIRLPHIRQSTVVVLSEADCPRPSYIPVQLPGLDDGGHDHVPLLQGGQGHVVVLPLTQHTTERQTKQENEFKFS